MKTPNEKKMPNNSFPLEDVITKEQLDFFNTHGFIHYHSVASETEVDAILEAMDDMEEDFLREGRKYLMGIPIQWGKTAEGKRFVNRFAYASEYSETIRKFVHDVRFEPIRRLIGENARLAEREKDGVVINNFINTPGSAYTQLGWHTDSPRDIFYNRRLPGPMLNVGLYLDDCPIEKGGVRILPGTHTQGLWKMLFRKFPMFFTHRPDPNEIPLVVKKGDLTIHDGRAWHRTAKASLSGEESRRRTMYMAWIDEPYDPRNEDSPVPLFKRLQQFVG